jgi:hypothetical protein
MGLLDLFSSKSTTSTNTTQQGVEGGGNIATGGSIINNEFPDEVSSFASEVIGLARDITGSAGVVTTAAASALGTVAEREKTPLTEFLPFAAVIAVGVVIIAMNWK